MRDRVQLAMEVDERATLDDRIALLSVLQELTGAVLKLFEPATPLDDFLEKVSARLGCAVTLCVSARAPGERLALLGSSGLARGSRALPLPELTARGVEDAIFPCPELRRGWSARWVVRVPREGEAPGSTWLLLWFEREPRSALQYRGMVRRVAHDLGLALSHREMVEKVVESERALQRLNAQLEAQIVETDRLAGLGILAAGIAHEINNPLAYVLGGLHFLSQQLADVTTSDEASLEEARAALRDVCDGADRIRTIVRDLKTFSRADDDPRRLVDLRPVLERAAQIAQGEIRHRARVRAEYGPSPKVRASESRLGQVFLNLLINAAHSIPAGAADRHEIRIRTATDEEGRALVEIRDTGCGMAPETLRRVFEPFFTTKPVGLGTGLGLSICRDFVTDLGGTIEVESELGKGSAFRVRLPAGREEAEGRAVRGSGARPPGRSPQ